MKTSAFVLFVLLLITFPSCRDEKIIVLPGSDQETVSDLEQEIDSLKENISKLQSVIALQAAHSSRKKIVSATEQIIDGANYRIITFSDHTDVRLPASVVESIVMEDTGEYKIEL
ncbi:MAG: hypothetical protein LBL33_06390, partial [Tannerella sp.]|nr:hypothetical protein [Tannerella sp.]